MVTAFIVQVYINVIVVGVRCMQYCEKKQK